MPYKFSPSSLSLLKECKKCFWLYYNKGLKRPSTIFPSLPSGVDNVIKKHFDHYRKNNGLPPEIERLNTDVTLFSNQDLLNTWRNNFKGLQWTDKKGNLLRGAIDDLLQIDHKLIVIDYKTRGYPVKNDTASFYQDQLDLYNFLLRKNGYKTEDYSYLLFYHPKKLNEDSYFVFNTDLVKVKTDVLNAERILSRAVETLDNKMPNSSDGCGFCKWNKEYTKSQQNL